MVKEAHVIIKNMTYKSVLNSARLLEVLSSIVKFFSSSFRSILISLLDLENSKSSSPTMRSASGLVWANSRP